MGYPGGGAAQAIARSQGLGTAVFAGEGAVASPPRFPGSGRLGWNRRLERMRTMQLVPKPGVPGLRGGWISAGCRGHGRSKVAGDQG